MRVIDSDNCDIQELAAIIRDGGVVVYPTDTAYGMGGRFDLPAVHQRIMDIKQRRDPKFTLIAGSIEQVEQHFELSPAQRDLVERHWPGALSLVVSKQYAVRVPASAFDRELAEAVGSLLIATSANLSGGATPYTAEEIIAQYADQKNQPDIVIDAGQLDRVEPSTVVRVADDGSVEVIRQGSVVV